MSKKLPTFLLVGERVYILYKTMDILDALRHRAVCRSILPWLVPFATMIRSARPRIEGENDRRAAEGQRRTALE